MSRDHRRQFLIAAGAPLAARLAQAQPPPKLRRIRLFSSSTLPQRASYIKLITNTLQRLGYDEGRNLVIESRYAEGKLERMPALADELVRLNVELIVTDSNASTLAAKHATRSIPIVMGGSSLPVETGQIDSYARPGGNITGLDWSATPDIWEKSYQILKYALPGAKRVVRLWNPKMAHAHLYGDEFVRRIASNTGLSLVSVEMTRAQDLAGALDRIAASRTDALSVSADEVINPHYAEIAAFAEKRKLVSIGVLGYASRGGLLHYGPHVQTMVDRLASYIDRILRGAKPGDLPVEKPTKYELVLNLKTARVMV